jgi:hypothetical protein
MRVTPFLRNASRTERLCLRQATPTPTPLFPDGLATQITRRLPPHVFGLRQRTKQASGDETLREVKDCISNR